MRPAADCADGWWSAVGNGMLRSEVLEVAQCVVLCFVFIETRVRLVSFLLLLFCVLRSG